MTLSKKLDNYSESVINREKIAKLLIDGLDVAISRISDRNLNIDDSGVIRFHYLEVSVNVLPVEGDNFRCNVVVDMVKSGIEVVITKVNDGADELLNTRTREVFDYEGFILKNVVAGLERVLLDD